MWTHPKITFWQPMIWIIGSGNHFTGKPLLGHESIGMTFLSAERFLFFAFIFLYKKHLHFCPSVNWVTTKNSEKLFSKEKNHKLWFVRQFFFSSFYLLQKSVFWNKSNSLSKVLMTLDEYFTRQIFNTWWQLWQAIC